MKLSVAPLGAKSDTLALFACEDRLVGKIDDGLCKKFREQAKLDNFKATVGSTMVFYPANRVVIAGLGKESEFTLETLRRAIAAIVNRVKTVTDSLAFVLPESDEAAQAAAESVVLSTYAFKKYKSSKDAEKLRSVVFLSDRPIEEDVRRGEVYARATCLARDMVNEPAGSMTPIRMAEIAKEVARQGKLQLKVLDEKQIEKLGMGSFRAVSLGSDQPPRFVHLSYSVPGAMKTIAIIGKGITFDSGGLCIKPADGMMDMKADMAGAAAVVGVMSALRSLKPKVNVHGIFPATENMPGGAAYKQRDVLRAMNGKTIEVTNTDAEGRLILADALAYASRLKPHAIIDLATLTGACVVALGTRISGIFGTDDPLMRAIVEAGKQEGEKVWPMPLEDEYFDELMKSEVADMKNSGGRPGGAITAACFLKQFVAPGIPWVHIDIAGPAIFDLAKHYNPPGATGCMVRTLLRYLQGL